MASRVLVTAALPYANGPIHLGHMLEFVQTDVHVRARKLAGEDVVFMWADDTHGTPIQVRARSEGIAPEELIARAYEEHVAVFRDFGIGYDIFHSTHSPENEKHAGIIFRAMEERGDIVARDVAQLYCPQDRMFLPDRFVRGTCPRCKTADQYGDVCESCGATYAPTELLEPRCAVCSTTPELRDSEHLFVPLARHEPFLRGWLAQPTERGETRLAPTVANYVRGWIEEGLRDWDISRDGPYFGFPIPGHPGKYFYVWFDAPIGYIAATDRWCADHGRDFSAYWHATETDTEIVHVIGKDIVYFHALFWPAMLRSAGYTTPSRIQVHGWLTVNGEKMSKSRGTFVLARTYLDHLPADYLRYYFAAKLGPGQDDLDLDLDDFAQRVNADLVNKAANLASRCIKFVTGRLGGTVGRVPDEAGPLLARAAERLAQAPELYRRFEYARVLRSAIEIAEEANVYLTDSAPWKLAESDPERARDVCTVGIAASRIVAAIFAPVLPGWAEKVGRSLRLPAPPGFFDAVEPLPPGHRLGEYETLAERLPAAALQAILEASKETTGGAAPRASYVVDGLRTEIGVEQFGPLDLRVGRIDGCEAVEGSHKLLRLRVDLGPLGARTIFSGIAPSYPDPAVLIGKHVVVLANLAPRKMRFGVSEGMVLASGASDDACTVCELDPRARPGERIT
jgi:methionyl-tRNA synthetase